MRVALISDIHANEIALLAVLDDIAKRGADRIVCLGDVATLGPRPHAVIGILRELGCTCILGNHDEFLLDATCVAHYSSEGAIVESVEWCRRKLTRAERDFLAGFEHTARIALDESASLLVFHGSPNSNTTDILATTGADRLDEVLAGRARGGHGGRTYARPDAAPASRQAARQSRERRHAVQGLHAKGARRSLMAHAEYATVEAEGGRIGVGLHRVALDARRLREAARASDLPLADYLVQQYT